MNLPAYMVPEQDEDLLRCGVILTDERLDAARASWAKGRECTKCSAKLPRDYAKKWCEPCRMWARKEALKREVLREKERSHRKFVEQQKVAWRLKYEEQRRERRGR